MTEGNGRPEDAGPPPERLITVNQVVAWNLARYRHAAGLKQEELAELAGWKKSAISDAERSVAGKFTREFNAQELAELSLALGVPLAAFFLPPEDDGEPARYLFPARKADGGTADMNVLMERVVIPENEDDTPAMDVYRARLRAAARRYLNPDWAAGVIGLILGTASSEEEVAAWLSAFRESAAILARESARWSGFADNLEKAASERRDGQ